MHAECRKESILDTAIKLAEEVGYKNITREELAIRLGVSRPLITYYFNPLTLLHNAILIRAIEEKNISIIVQAIGERDILPEDLTNDIKAQVIASLFK